MEEARQQREMTAQQHQKQYQARYAPDINIRPRYSVGYQVYAKNHRLSNKAAGCNSSLGPSWTGPHTILENISGEVYWVLKNNEQHKIHGNELRPAPPADHVTDDSEKLRASLSNERTASYAPPTGVGELPRPSWSRTDSENDVRGRCMLRKRKGVTYRDARPYASKEK